MLSEAPLDLGTLYFSQRPSSLPLRVPLPEQVQHLALLLGRELVELVYDFALVYGAPRSFDSEISSASGRTPPPNSRRWCRGCPTAALVGPESMQIAYSSPDESSAIRSKRTLGFRRSAHTATTKTVSSLNVYTTENLNGESRTRRRHTPPTLGAASGCEATNRTADSTASTKRVASQPSICLHRTSSARNSLAASAVKRLRLTKCRPSTLEELVGVDSG